MLDNLLDIEIAYSLLKGTSEDDKDPIDAHYEKLKTKIEVNIQCVIDRYIDEQIDR